MQREQRPALEATGPRQAAERPRFTEVHHRMWARSAGPAWLRRFLGDRNGLRLDAEGLYVRLGPWVVKTPLDNLAGARVTGPYRPWRALGPHLSLTDRCGRDRVRRSRPRGADPSAEDRSHAAATGGPGG
ncbi:hypothetical protein AB0K15_31110 [Amycolatopsis sp. NPDC049253]|uniref:hypothetical protein n=1 Tax=Amycolatopsis sp. NPDC049253 TaxID=3155274 RepID=UPI003426AC46